MEEVEAGEAMPDIDDLVVRLRVRVASRRATGEYPDGLEEEMTAHFRRLLDQRRDTRLTPDIAGPVRAAGKALPIQANKIPVESDVPGGRTLHAAIARLVGRQTRGALQQVQAFAQPAHAALEALNAAVEELNRRLNVDVTQSLDALYERQAAQERMLTPVRRIERRLHGADPEDPFEGSPEKRLEHYRTLAERLAGVEPVLDIGCGQGEFVELLIRSDVEARGVEEGVALEYLRTLDDKALGGVTAIQVIDHFSALEIPEFVAVVADKVRPGGRVLVETFEPQSLYGPIHPAVLTLLFREAGFSTVDIEWHPPPQTANLRWLNQVFFACQGYLVVATR